MEHEQMIVQLTVVNYRNSIIFNKHKLLNHIVNLHG